MFNLIPFVLILASFIVMLILIIRKFPQLSLLDVEQIPEVKEQKKKEAYLKKRVLHKGDEKKAQWQDWLGDMTQKAMQLQKAFRDYVGVIEYKLFKQVQAKRKEKQAANQETQEETIDTLFVDAQRAYESESFDKAEQAYIAIIRLDAKAADAYYGLLQVYLAQGQLTEAVQTGKYLLQLEPHLERGYVKMAEIYEQLGDVDEAIAAYQQAVLIHDLNPKRFAKLAQLLQQVEDHETALEAIQQAVELEPENPKYLDSFIELAIMMDDTVLAKEGYKQMRLVNPDNAKLPRWKEAIYQ